MAQREGGGEHVPNPNNFSDVNERPPPPHRPLRVSSVGPSTCSNSSLLGLAQNRLLSLLAKKKPCDSVFWLSD